jgi:hypothetical protein
VSFGHDGKRYQDGKVLKEEFIMKNPAWVEIEIMVRGSAKG